MDIQRRQVQKAIFSYFPAIMWSAFLTKSSKIELASCKEAVKITSKTRNRKMITAMILYKEMQL